MSSKEYVRMILERLLKKYHNRTGNSKRRVIVKPTELYKSYADNNADIVEKQSLYEAAEELLKRKVITVDYLKFSTDIEKIYLCEDRLDEIQRFLQEEYGIAPQNVLLGRVKAILERYGETGELARNYSKGIWLQIDGMGKPLERNQAERIEANLKMLCFMDRNEEELYVREASMLVYGDSKWFEENNCEEICSSLRNILGKPKEENERNDAVLAYYHIMPPEQEIFIKGSWKIEWDDYILETAKLKGGIAIASNDIQDIKKITVYSSKMMTIENKTSYQRMNMEDVSCLYLGGFANRHQILFLKKVLRDNPEAEYHHFGDIDAGGFLIHRHLCRSTGADFKLYCMGIRQLEDQRFRNCLKKLTENDIGRLELLAEDEVYRDVVRYMKEHNVKLEQEIVSYYAGRCR